MARYQGLFDQFGLTALGQVAGATLIGGLIGFGVLRHGDLPANTNPAWVIGGTAALGFFGGVMLAAYDIVRKRRAAGIGRRLPTWALVLLILFGVFVFFAACIVWIVH